MSFDVFFMRFQAGEGARVNTELLGRLLGPYLCAEGTNLYFSDGEAAIYGTDDFRHGFMVNHVTGIEAWHVLTRIAHESGMVIFPVGCPTAVPKVELIADLPERFRGEAVVVNSGDDLMQMMAAN